jgi:hypothetical protein
MFLFGIVLCAPALLFADLQECRGVWSNKPCANPERKMPEVEKWERASRGAGQSAASAPEQAQTIDGAPRRGRLIEAEGPSQMDKEGLASGEARTDAQHETEVSARRKRAELDRQARTCAGELEHQLKANARLRNAFEKCGLFGPRRDVEKLDSYCTEPQTTSQQCSQLRFEMAGRIPEAAKQRPPCGRAWSEMAQDLFDAVFGGIK